MAITEPHGYTEHGQVRGHADVPTIPKQTAGHSAETAEPPARTAQPRVSVVIPTLNEARNLDHVFAALPAGLHEVILVDGHSVDGTPDVARRLRPDVRVVKQTRTGKGNALACGFAAATGDIIVMIDADGSTDPAEIPRFVEALTSGADFAKGSRFAPGAGSTDITPLRKLGNRAARPGRQPHVRHPLLRPLLRLQRVLGQARTCLRAAGGVARAAARSGATGSRSRPCSTSAPPPPGWRSPRCRASSTRGSTARATCARSATASACSAPSSPSGGGHDRGAAGRIRPGAPARACRWSSPPTRHERWTQLRDAVASVGAQHRPALGDHRGRRPQPGAARPRPPRADRRRGHTERGPARRVRRAEHRRGPVPRRGRRLPRRRRVRDPGTGWRP